MWLATLNPGGKVRHGRRKKRKLSAWQRLVRKAGGVMQAVKLSRKQKRKRRAGGRRKYRRNSFLTTTLTSGGAMVGMNAPRRKRRSRKNRKTRSRRSAVSRRSRRSRSRKAMRRSKMARKVRRRRHKTPSRGRGGRFKASRRHRRSSRRRTRRNPVLPISWNPSRRRRRRSRRNPLFLSRKGFSSRKHKGYRRLRVRRHAPRHWHNNPRRSHRRRRSYRNNPVLPISWNPGGVLSAGPLPAIMGNLKSFIDVRFWTETGVPAAAGFFGSKAIGGLVLSFVPASVTAQIPAAAQPFVKMAADAIGGSVLAWAVGRYYNKKAGDAVWLGTVVNVAYSVMKQLLGGTAIAKTIGLDGLGDDLAQRMRSEIANRVQNSINGGRLNGVGSYLRTTNMRGLSEYVTERDMRNSPNYAPGNRLGDEEVGDPGF